MRRAFQHTPGPWRVEARGGMVGREVRAGELVIADVNTTTNNSNRLANARLIALAPEMAEIIEQTAWHYEQTQRDGVSQNLPHKIGQAARALRARLEET